MKIARLRKLLNEYLRDFIEDNGFRMHLRGHHRDLIRINNRIMQGIYFEHSGWDKDSTTVHIYIKPLFTSPDIADSLGLGARIGDVLEKWDIWWTLKDEKSTQSAFREIRDFLENHALPWFAMTRSSEEILESMEKYPEHPCFIFASKYPYDLGYIALDAGRYDKAKEYLQEYLDILQGVDPDLILDVEIKRKEEVNKLLASLDNPEKIRRILDENTPKTAEVLKIKLEEWEGEDDCVNATVSTSRISKRPDIRDLGPSIPNTLGDRKMKNYPRKLMEIFKRLTGFGSRPVGKMKNIKEPRRSKDSGASKANSMLKHIETKNLGQNVFKNPYFKHEQSFFKGGKRANWGNQGSMIFDVVQYNTKKEIMAIYDYKFDQEAALTAQRIAKMRQYLPRKYRNVQICEIRIPE